MLDELVARIREVLQDEKYGLTASEICKKANLGVSARVVGLVCAWLDDVVAVGGFKRAKRWRLRYPNNGKEVVNYEKG